MNLTLKRPAPEKDGAKDAPKAAPAAAKKG
jgi:hypothetical protein